MMTHIFLEKNLKRRTVLTLLGTILALAFAPIHLIPLVWLVFLGVLYSLDQVSSPRTSFWDGWWFGLGFFVASLYWVAIAPTVDLKTFWWVIPFALFGLPLILSFFIAPVFYLTTRCSSPGFSRILLFAAFWVFFEWLRAHLFTGFPWNLLGYVWTAVPAYMQLAAWGGVYLLSLLTLLIVGITYLGIRGRLFEKRLMIGAYVVAAFIGIAGLSRLQEAPPTSSGPWMRLVQPSIPQSIKWDPEQREANLYRILSLSHEKAPHRPQVIIWPETAVAFFLEQEPRLRRLISQVIPEGSYLITGALRRTHPGHEPLEIWNSVVILDHKGAVISFFNKFHLVPFGEYVPWRKELSSYIDLSWIKKVTAGTVDFSKGEGPETISAPNLPAFSPLVCYEAIFPGAVTNPHHPRPLWLLNLTNDAWYGNSSGPYQHLEIVRMRAVEEGLPLVRAANNGVSAVFDGYGREIVSLPLNEVGIRDFQMPIALSPTPYARFGDTIILVLLGVLLLAGALKERRFKS